MTFRRFVLAAVLVGTGAARAEETLVPVVVAAVDIAAGETVTMEMIAQRSAPTRLVTSSVVKPDSASYIVNQKVLVPVLAGDMLLWSQFETTKQGAHQKCEAVLGSSGDARTQVARARAAIKAGAAKK